MSQLKRNMLANFVGRGWTALAGFIFVPFYIKFMGIEAYGLVSIFVTLQAVFLLLDMGLSTTMNRELARYSVLRGSERDTRDLVRTLEFIYWIVAMFIALFMVFISPLISSKWINPQELSADTIQSAVLMMGLAIAFQFPFALYEGGLMGLQRQVLYNGLLIFSATMRGVGAVLVLWLVSPTIQAFFTWQIIVSVTQTLLSALFLWRSLPGRGGHARFKKKLLSGIWRFTASISGIGILSVILMQMDKVVLSKMLTLENFGYYSLATVVASGLYVFMSPIFLAVFPRFSQLVAKRDEADLTILYHQTCQLMSVLVLSVAITVALFAPEIILLWTGDATVSDRTHLLVSLLITGTAFNAMCNVPYALQLAYGWTRLALVQNVIAVTLLLPLLLLATKLYGATGAASVWIILNAGYVIISIQFMHRKLVKKEKWRWYYQDIGVPLVGAITIGLISRWVFPEYASKAITAALLLAVFLLTLLASALVTPFTRNLIKKLAPSTKPT